MTYHMLKQRAVRDALGLGAIFIVLWGLLSRFNVSEWLHETLDSFEHFQGDEVILAVTVTGFAGLIFATRRAVDLWAEVKRRQAAELEARWIARHDVLTRLPNRRFVERHLKDRGDDRSPIVAYAIDLDGFKKVNDLMGHHGGDALLAAVADRLDALDPDAVVARVGGDEFVVLREGTGAGAGVTLIDPVEFGRVIVAALTAPIDLDGNAVEIGASVGVAVYPDDVAGLGDLLRRADIAMYAAKRGGRNRVVRFDGALEVAAVTRARDEADLRQAIRDRDIVPHFQPLVDLESGRLYGFEALARWRRRDGGEVPPDRFVALAEEIGLIVELSDALLAQACRAATAWPADVSLSFNISPTQLTDHLLGLRVARVLGEAGLSPHRLIIEITETGLVRDRDAALRIIADLKAAGIRVALDDFGIGYSSLSHIANLAVDEIKIDRSFVAECLRDPRQMKIITAIVALGRGLGLRTTAEGVEDTEQLERLKRAGCDAAQGYLFGAAIPAEETLALILARGIGAGRRSA